MLFLPTLLRSGLVLLHLLTLTTRVVAHPTIAAWLSDWQTTDLDSVRWSEYDELDLMSAATTATPDRIAFDSPGDTDKIRQFTTLAKQNGPKPILSVGGWTGSRYTISDALDGFGFDGVSLDWQSPNTEGIGCNEKSEVDSSNLLLFVKVLRERLGPKRTISATGPMTGFLGASGDPLYNTSDYAQYLDSLSIMAFDVAGNWNSQTGANAPLSSSCAPAEQAASVTSAFEYWTSTGFPAEKLVLGIPSYGYVFNLTYETLEGTRNGPIPSFVYQNKLSSPVQAGLEDTRGNLDICGNAEDHGSSYAYADLVRNGMIEEDGRPRGKWTRYWNKCTATPFLVNHAEAQFLTYDDPVSVAIKAHFVRERGMRGVKLLDYAGDTSSGRLVASAREQLERAAGSHLGISVEENRQRIA